MKVRSQLTWKEFLVGFPIILAAFFAVIGIVFIGEQFLRSVGIH